MIAPAKLAIASVLVISTTSAQRVLRQEAGATQNLIGEELVDATNVYSFADRMFAEADDIWTSSGWTKINNNTVLNEGIDVSGVFAKAGIQVTRATAIVNKPAQQLFDLLTSVEGYKLIDPISKPEDHAQPPLETFDATNWRTPGPNKRLEVARTTTQLPIPFFNMREFVVLNAIDSNTRYFISKSIQHKAVPGCSSFGASTCSSLVAKNTVRALNTFGAQIEPVKGDASKSVVRLINYADLSGNFAAFLMNLSNKNFLVDMVGRFRDAQL